MSSGKGIRVGISQASITAKINASCTKLCETAKNSKTPFKSCSNVEVIITRSGQNRDANISEGFILLISLKCEVHASVIMCVHIENV